MNTMVLTLGTTWQTVMNIMLFATTNVVAPNQFGPAWENANAPVKPVHVIELCRSEPHSPFFIGTVEYGKTAKLSFSNSGMLTYIAPTGGEIQGGGFNKKTVEVGEVVAQQNTYQAENNIKTATMLLKIAENKLYEQQKNYDRELLLLGKRVISDRQFLHTQQEYNNTKLELDQAKLKLEQETSAFNDCQLRAPFRGVVDEVYFSPGTMVDKNVDIIKISIISTVKVVIPMLDDISRRINLTSEVSIMPSGVAKPSLAWFENSDIKPFSLECYVKNYLIPVFNHLSPEEKKLPVVSDFSYVSQLSRGPDSPLWIEPRMLKRDRRGSYVWRIRNAKAMSSEHKIKRVNSLEKVYVTADESKISYGIYTTVMLKDPGCLEHSDILAAGVPETLKDGDQVLYQDFRWAFRPGEKVIVLIAPNPTVTGFYIPVQALHQDYHNDALHIVVNDHGRARMISVRVVEEFQHYFCIEADELKEGMQCVVYSADSIRTGDALKVVRTDPPVDPGIHSGSVEDGVSPLPPSGARTENDLKNAIRKLNSEDIRQ